jgi:hypothetical protein
MFQVIFMVYAYLLVQKQIVHESVQQISREKKLYIQNKIKGM